MSYYDRKRTTPTYLLYNDVNGWVKNCAVVAGFDSDNFGTHSLRIGGACTLRAGGASETAIQHLGRWKSMESCRGYQEASLQEFIRMGNVFSSSDNFTVADLRLLHTKANHNTSKKSSAAHNGGSRFIY